MKRNVYAKSSLVILFVFNIIASFAQSHFVEGFMVTNANDTLTGFIYDNNNNWKVKAIQFAKSKTEKPTEYPLDSFASFYLKSYNEYYFSRTVDIDKKPIRSDKLESFPARNIVRETVLLKLLAGGKINLYYYGDENSKKHFFVEKYGKLEELAYVKYISEGKYLVESPFYIETLKSLTSDCEKVNVKKPQFVEDALKSIVEDYNSCFMSVNYVRTKEKAKLSAGLMLGGKMTNFNYEGTDNTINKAYSYPGADQATYNSTSTIFGGLYLDLLPGRASNPFSGGMQILWQESGTFTGTLERANVYYRQYTAKFSYLTTAANFKIYILKSRRPALYVKGGIGMNYLVNYTANAYVHDVIIGAPKSKDFMSFKSTGIHYQGAIGLSIRKAFVELRYQQDKMIGDNPEASGKLNSVCLMLGYSLF